MVAAFTADTSATFTMSLAAGIANRMMDDTEIRDLVEHDGRLSAAKGQ